MSEERRITSEDLALFAMQLLSKEEAAEVAAYVAQSADARRELASLDAAARAPAQAWLDKAAARDAALAASRQFADDTMAALAKSAQ